MPNQTWSNSAVNLLEDPAVHDEVDRGTFIKCAITGPAVLVLSGCDFAHNRFPEGIDRTGGAPAGIQGERIIKATQCSFWGCTFERVRFAGPPEALAGIQ